MTLTELEKRATPGPWEPASAAADDYAPAVLDPESCVQLVSTRCPDITERTEVANAQLIAHMRNTYATILEALKAAIKMWREDIGAGHCCPKDHCDDGCREVFKEDEEWGDCPAARLYDALAAAERVEE